MLKLTGGILVVLVIIGLCIWLLPYLLIWAISTIVCAVNPLALPIECTGKVWLAAFAILALLGGSNASRK